MEGSISAQSRVIHSNPFLLSSLRGSFSPPIQDASTVTPEEVDDAGISLELTLLYDPWPFEKKLRASDVDRSSRLLLTRSFVEKYVLKEKGGEMEGRIKSKAGMEVPVWDADTSSKHQLVFGYWESTKGYVLKGSWIQQFVKRRGLVVGDEIGIFWDERERMFYFKVLHKVARGTSKEVAMVCQYCN